MSTPLNADLPDWSILTNPNILNASFNNQGSGLIDQLFQSPNPYRIWAAWIDVSAGTGSTYAGGVLTWGAQIGDGSGASLLRVQVHFAVANQVNQQALALPINGYTPKISAGQYTTNLVTDAGITNMFTRANGGILFSIP